jgi:2,4-dienoyl-CoA reductase-like NADH-dependent reductase (Old Yellow Enzyme family)
LKAKATPPTGTPTSSRYARTLVDRYERGEFDIAAVGRAALANPDFVNKIRAGRHDELIPYDQHQHKLTLR